MLRCPMCETGLHDEEGTPICSGDEIEYNDGFYYFRGTVVYECGAFGIGVKETLPSDLFSDYCRNDNFISFWEIIWNSDEPDEGFVPNVKIIGKRKEEL